MGYELHPFEIGQVSTPAGASTPDTTDQGGDYVSPSGEAVRGMRDWMTAHPYPRGTFASLLTFAVGARAARDAVRRNRENR